VRVGVERGKHEGIAIAWMVTVTALWHLADRFIAPACHDLAALANKIRAMKFEVSRAFLLRQLLFLLLFPHLLRRL
jgi:hypothetical protein